MPQFPFTQSPLDAEDILYFLNTHPYVKSASLLGSGGFSVALHLDSEATDIFVQYLSASRHAQAIYVCDSSAPLTTTVRSSADGADKSLFKRELTLAFSKVSQFLEYQELKREYAAGRVPVH